MKLFGYELTLQKKATPMPISAVNSWLQWRTSDQYSIVNEPFTGAWQRNIIATPETNLTNSSVYVCVTGIASDIAKMRIKLDRIDDDGIWNELTKPGESPWLNVLRHPNHFQNRIKFIELWLISKLLYGNTYVLKERNDARGLVTGLYILHPKCVVPLVTETGDVYYEIRPDSLAGVQERIVVPASEIIHDLMAPLWHPLIGVSPIYACSMSASLGSSIQTNSTRFFSNRSLPGGMLTAPGMIPTETATRLKNEFTSNFSGANLGKLFVAGDGLKFEAFTMPAEQSQLIEQLRWTVEDVARAFRYPLWKLGAPMPPYTKPDLAQTAYYSDCLHPYIESLELCLDEGLELPNDLGTEFDLDALVRMDTATLYDANNKAAGWMKINEMRLRANLAPIDDGGDSAYLQQQNYSLEALAKRDAAADPFASKTPARNSGQDITPPSNAPADAQDMTPADMPAQKRIEDRSEFEYQLAYQSALEEELTP